MGKSSKHKLRGGKPPSVTPVGAVVKAADQAAAIPPPPPPPPPATLAAQTQKITLAEDMTPDQRRQKEHQDNLNALRTLAEGAVQYWRPRMRGRFSRGRSKTKKLSGERKVQYVSAAPQMRGKLSRRDAAVAGKGAYVLPQGQQEWGSLQILSSTLHTPPAPARRCIYYHPLAPVSGAFGPLCAGRGSHLECCPSPSRKAQAARSRRRSPSAVASRIGVCQGTPSSLPPSVPSPPYA